MHQDVCGLKPATCHVRIKAIAEFKQLYHDITKTVA